MNAMQTLIDNRDFFIVLGVCLVAFKFFFAETFGNGNAEFYAELDKQHRSR
ncbi:hypothetical protein SAMN05446935_0341 [Burkholderia sp. YR290]|nr:hypothetical protein SAMN05446935_0341 [Burkholderia sp. YR290]